MKPDTLLFRQINPGWLDEGVPTTQGFKPTSKDNARLSIDDGSLITAEDSCKKYTECLGLKSVGVLAVTVDECNQHYLPIVPDPQPCQPSHAIIDFSNLSRGQIARKAKYLKSFATQRGWQYQPPEPAPNASPSTP